MLNALSFDVEDYYQVGAFACNVAVADWDKYESRVESNTRKLLKLLSSQRVPVKATFFVLGWIAERYPALVPEIASYGHEIASHGYSHQLIYTMTEDGFRDDVRRTRELLRKQSGQEVAGYRAPSFSIVKRTPWAHRVLVEEGYRYDSSVFPIHHDLHGNADAPREIHIIQTEAGQIQEFPPGVVRRFGQNIPVSGGGYFRFFPYFLTSHWLRCINSAGFPFVFYMHPWEVDPEQPRISGASFKSRFRHYLNLRQTLQRLQKLINDFQFAPVNEVLELAHPCFSKLE
jgi:polysaccharide deacetylase family protein (PEP-CTERM system associated)